MIQSHKLSIPAPVGGDFFVMQGLLQAETEIINVSNIWARPHNKYSYCDMASEGNDLLSTPVLRVFCSSCRMLFRNLEIVGLENKLLFPIRFYNPSENI